MRQNLAALLLLLLLAACGGGGDGDDGGGSATGEATEINGQPATLYRGQPTEFAVQGDRIYMFNYTDSRTFPYFKQVLAKHPEVTTLVFTRAPGSADDESNLEMGRYIRGQQLSTYTHHNSVIASGAVDLYCAGVNRTMEGGTLVGVHSWADSDGTEGAEVPRTSSVHQEYIRYYRALGIPESFYWFTLRAAPSSGVHWMSWDEIDQYQLMTGPKIAPTEITTPWDGRKAAGESRLPDGTRVFRPVKSFRR